MSELASWQVQGPPKIQNRFDYGKLVLVLGTGGVYSVLVRRQLQSSATNDSTNSLASIGEEDVVESDLMQNGSLQRLGSEDPNADLLRRQSTGTGLHALQILS